MEVKPKKKGLRKHKIRKTRDFMCMDLSSLSPESPHRPQTRSFKQKKQKPKPITNQTLPIVDVNDKSKNSVSLLENNPPETNPDLCEQTKTEDNKLDASCILLSSDNEDDDKVVSDRDATLSPILKTHKCDETISEDLEKSPKSSEISSNSTPTFNTAEEKNVPRTSIRKRWQIPSVSSTGGSSFKLVFPSCSSESSFNDSSLSKEPVEEIRPSTSDNIKRRTYEIEESVNDVSLLKEVAQMDSRLSLNLDIFDSSTSSLEVSKVTARKPLKENVRKPSSEAVGTPSPLRIRRPASTSTPVSIKKNNNTLLKNALHNVAKKTITKTPNKSLTKSFVSKVKVPNFAAIHQKHFDQMEDISAYAQRKEERAKLLLSSSIKSPQKSVKKQFRFHPDTKDTVKSPGFIPLPNTPKPKNCPESSKDTPTPGKRVFKPVKTPLPLILPVKTTTLSRVKTPLPKVVKNKISRLPVRIHKNVVVPRKEEMQTMVVKKAPAPNNTRDKKRAIIKGVRSNRRFDLLMKMRNCS